MPPTRFEGGSPRRPSRATPPEDCEKDQVARWGETIFLLPRRFLPNRERDLTKQEDGTGVSHRFLVDPRRLFDRKN
jgi:hypothetical protein